MAVGGTPEVACIGDNCVDVALEPSDGTAVVGSEFAGGNAFNVAVELARRGREVAYFGAVGEDPQAELILRAAQVAGLDMSGIERIAGATGRTVVSRDAAGERRFVSEDYGVAAGYRLTDAIAERIAAARWAHFARQADLAQWAPRLRAGGVRLSCDLGLSGGTRQLSELAPQLDAVFLSAAAGGGRTGEELLRDALDAGAELVVVTLGAAGSIAASGEQTWQIDAVPVPRVIDSLGAGDAYIAAFIGAQLDDRPIADSLQEGAQAGAAACLRWGLANPLHTDEVPA